MQSFARNVILDIISTILDAGNSTAPTSFINQSLTDKNASNNMINV
jgi:hypothetical protein